MKKKIKNKIKKNKNNLKNMARFGRFFLEVFRPIRGTETETSPILFFFDPKPVFRQGGFPGPKKTDFAVFGFSVKEVFRHNFRKIPEFFGWP